MRVFRLTVIVGILTLFVQCASVPLTGRKQVILLQFFTFYKLLFFLI